MIKELHASRDGMDIWGEIYLPGNGDGKYPLVILSHEFNESHKSMEQYAKMFQEAGIAAYVFDFCGGSTVSRSDGTMLNLSWLTEIEDLKAVYKMLIGCPFTDPDNLFLMGGSMGGSVTALTSAELGKETVKAVVLLYPALMGPENARNTYESKESMPDIIQALGITVGKRFYADLYDMDSYAEVSRYDGDVLIIHGDADRLVPLSSSVKAASMFPHATLEIIPGADHIYSGNDAVYAGTKAVEFVKAHI